MMVKNAHKNIGLAVSQLATLHHIHIMATIVNSSQSCLDFMQHTVGIKDTKSALSMHNHNHKHGLTALNRPKHKHELMTEQHERHDNRGPKKDHTAANTRTLGHNTTSTTHVFQLQTPLSMESRSSRGIINSSWSNSKDNGVSAANYSSNPTLHHVHQPPHGISSRSNGKSNGSCGGISDKHGISNLNSNKNRNTRSDRDECDLLLTNKENGTANRSRQIINQKKKEKGQHNTHYSASTCISTETKFNSNLPTRPFSNSNDVTATTTAAPSILKVKSRGRICPNLTLEGYNNHKEGNPIVSQSPSHYSTRSISSSSNNGKWRNIQYQIDNSIYSDQTNGSHKSNHRSTSSSFPRATADLSLSCMGKGGRILLTRTSNCAFLINSLLLCAKDLQVMGVSIANIPPPRRRNILNTIASYFSQGLLQAHVTKTYPIELLSRDDGLQNSKLKKASFGNAVILYNSASELL